MPTVSLIELPANPGSVLMPTLPRVSGSTDQKPRLKSSPRPGLQFQLLVRLRKVPRSHKVSLKLGLTK
jgi:hypothetical protein